MTYHFPRLFHHPHISKEKWAKAHLWIHHHTVSAWWLSHHLAHLMPHVR